MRPVPGTPLHSDEVRVAAMNRLLKGKARVITANKRAPERDFLFHYQVDTTARNWEEHFHYWLRTTHGGVITDVYLDYFFFLVSWYRQGYGQKWYDHLLVLNFSGFAYLPIPQDPRGDPLPTRDHKYHEQLKYDVWEKRGQFLKGNQLTTVPWCKATMNVHEDLVAVDSRKNEAPTRNHRYQAHYRIEGILRISARQMQNLDYLRRGGRRQYTWKTVNKRRVVQALTPLPGKPTPAPPTPAGPAATVMPPTPAPTTPAPTTPAPTTPRTPSANVHADTLLALQTPRVAAAPAPAATVTQTPTVTAAPTPTVTAAPTPTPTVTAAPTPAPTYSVKTQVTYRGVATNKLKARIVHNKGRYQVRLPKSLTGTGKRGEITFKKTVPFGIHQDFGEFLHQRLKRVAAPWKTAAAAGQWYVSRRETFKQKVEADYQAHVARRGSTRAARMAAFNMASAGLARMHGTDVNIVSPLVSAGQTALFSVGLPDFPELRTAKSKLGEVQAIRIGSRRNRTNRNLPHAYLYLPGPLIRAAKGKQVSLGTKYGVNVAWIQFVHEYVTSVVSKWTTIEKARAWVDHQVRTFVQHLQHLWGTMGGNVVPVTKPWSIKPSKLPIDREYVDKGWFPPEAATDPGMGLWCERAGLHKFEYLVTGDLVEVVPSDGMTKTQGYYGIDANEDKTKKIVPTVAALHSGVLYHTFYVGHRRANPTHKAVYTDDGKALLVPHPEHGPTAAGEEFCFDYGCHKKDVQDNVTLPDE